MNATEYKKFHESFMQDNHGSTAFHTFLCICFTVLCATYVSIRPKYLADAQYVYEYIVIVLSMISAHTIFAENIYFLNFIISVLLLYEFMFYFKNIRKVLNSKNVFISNKIPLISLIRSLTYVITVFAILAVDFQSFPRYLAKTERYGYSLMDTGVGLFVLVSGLVHKDLHRDNLKQILKTNVKVIVILVILGVGRFVSVKQLDYQEHVSEYGVHWNFFFTIACCKLISFIILLFTNQALLISIIVLIIHESLLYCSLQDWVFSGSPRTSLISANREGISSSLGYVCLYLFSVHLKHLLSNQKVSKLKVLLHLFYTSLILCVFSCIVNNIFPISRTLANAGYCLYMCSVTVTITTVLYFITVMYEASGNAFSLPSILVNINSNGLLYFLAANLLTGAVNMAVRTLLVSEVMTFIILNVYMIVTLVVIEYLTRVGIKV